MTAPAKVDERTDSRANLLMAKLRALPAWLLPLTLVLALALILRFMFFFGSVWVDSFTYADATSSMARWEPVFTPHLTSDIWYSQYVRLSIVAPAALLFKLFGTNDAAATAFPFIVSLGMIALAFFFMRRFAGLTAAVAAAALAAIFPWYVVMGTQFMPDIVQAGFVSFASVCLLFALYDDSLSRRRRFWLYVGVGAGMAIAFYARGTAVAVVPAFAVIAAIRWRKLGPEVLGAAAGGLAVLVVFEALLMGLGSGPFEDLRVLWHISSESNPRFELTYLRDLVKDPMFWPFTILTFGGGVLWLSRVRPRTLLADPFLALVILGIAQYLYYEFFMALPGVPTWWKEPRYISSLVFPMLLFGGLGIGIISNWLWRHWPAVAGIGVAGLTGVMLFVSIHGIESQYDFYVIDGGRVDALAWSAASFLDNDPTAPVYITGDNFARVLSYRMGSAGTFYERMVTNSGRLKERFDRSGVQQVTPGSYVVSVPSETWWASDHAPALDWTRVWGSRAKGLAIYHVATPTEASFTDYQDVTPPMQIGGADLESIGLSRAWQLPHEHMGIELNFDSPVREAMSLPIALRCDGRMGSARRLNVPAGARQVRVDVLFQRPAGAKPGVCDIVANPSEWGRIGQLTLPAFASVEGETLSTAAGTGWQVFNNPRFSGEYALLGYADHLTTTVPIPKSAPGKYWVDLLMYDYGTGPGAITVTLNGITSTVPWGSTGEPGVVRVTVPLDTATGGNHLSLTFDRGAQSAVIFDAVALISEHPPAQAWVD